MPIKVTYVARSFLDYRIPVIEALWHALDKNLTFIYSADYVPRRCQDRLGAAIGESAIGMTGEWRIGPNETAGFANSSFRVVFQRGLWREIARSTPDVLVGDGFFQWTAAAISYSLLHRRALVICYERTFHTERRVQSLRAAYRRAVIRRVDAMACNGQESRRYAMNLGMAPGRITVGQMAADSEYLAGAVAAVSQQERWAFRLANGEPQLVLLAVGKLNARKGISELLNGWAQFEKRRLASAKLIILGDGPDRNELEVQARELGVQGVRFVGHVGYEEIPKYYAVADALIMPTLEDNWSLVVPEAMACGLPILCSIYNGCHPELIEEGRNGWKFDPLDVASIARVLEECALNANQLKQMGEESRIIESRYSPKNAAHAIARACAIAMSESARRS